MKRTMNGRIANNLSAGTYLNRITWHAVVQLDVVFHLSCEVPLGRIRGHLGPMELRGRGIGLRAVRGVVVWTGRTRLSVEDREEVLHGVVDYTLMPGSHLKLRVGDSRKTSTVTSRGVRHKDVVAFRELGSTTRGVVAAS